MGGLYIHHWEGEDYATPTENYNQTIDVYVGNVQNGIDGIMIDSFFMEYNNTTQEPNPRLPVIVDNQTSPTARYPVTLKNINAYYYISGTTAGSVYPVVIEYTTQGMSGWPGYKKMIYVFQGYENDTTTNQTIPWPTNGPPHNNTLGFNTTPAINANSIGLIITASTSGLTIIAPSSKTTYSGVVIVEVY